MLVRVDVIGPQDRLELRGRERVVAGEARGRRAGASRGRIKQHPAWAKASVEAEFVGVVCGLSGTGGCIDRPLGLRKNKCWGNRSSRCCYGQRLHSSMQVRRRIIDSPGQWIDNDGRSGGKDVSTGPGYSPVVVGSSCRRSRRRIPPAGRNSVVKCIVQNDERHAGRVWRGRLPNSLRRNQSVVGSTASVIDTGFTRPGIFQRTFAEERVGSGPSRRRLLSVFSLHRPKSPGIFSFGIATADSCGSFTTLPRKSISV